MRPPNSLRALALLALALGAAAAEGWSFTGAQAKKGPAVRGEIQYLRFDLFGPEPKQGLVRPMDLPADETLTIALTLEKDGTPTRPHQAFILLKDKDGDLETFFPLRVRPKGEASINLTHKDIPPALLVKSDLTISIVVGAFGPEPGKQWTVGTLQPTLSAAARDALEKEVAATAAANTYGAKPEIHHTFRSDAKSPPKIVTLVFTLAVLASFVGLLAVWFPILGANFGHLGTAMSAAPVSHTAFFGSLIGLEGCFFAYYTRWSLFQTLPAVSALGAVAYFSGSRALTEVKARRERKER